MRLIDADALIEFCAERWIPLNIDAVNMQPTIQPEKTQLSQEGTTLDLISRQAAIDGKISIQLANGVEIYSDEAVPVEYLKRLPSVQPEPHEGHWIPVTNGRGGHECDRCHEYAPSYQSGDEHLSKYCPKCGAKMKGVTK